MQQNDEVYVLYIQVVLRSTFAVVTGHPQETQVLPGCVEISFVEYGWVLSNSI